MGFVLFSNFDAMSFKPDIKSIVSSLQHHYLQYIFPIEQSVKLKNEILKYFRKVR